ncbi:glycosyltransferase [Desulfovibrio sp. DS-1]|nr:glycosyltransferase [Desulfovibrio sp. DS-1]
MSEPRIAIIIPAYNEAQTVAETMKAFHAVCPTAALYVVDNNSQDATADIAAETLQRLGATGRVLREWRQGKGNAVRRAFLEVDADVYVLTDADMTYPAEQLPELLAPVLEGKADMVCGDRRSHGDYSRENTRPFHGVGNRLVQYLVNVTSGTQLVDIMTGYRVLSRLFVRCYPIVVEGFQIETDMTLFAAQARMRIVEIPVRYVNRPEGSFSKLNTFRDGARVLRTIFTVFNHCNPLAFSMLVAFFLAVGSILAGSVVITEWLTTSYITHVPLAVLAVALGLLSATFLGTGILLNSMSYQRKLDLERVIQRTAWELQKRPDAGETP